jgi:hypothetical protein
VNSETLDSGTLELENTGTLELENTGTHERWNSRTFELVKIENTTIYATR